MGSLTKLWAGRIFGTNTGNLFLSFDETGPNISGTLRFLDAEYGLVVYHLEGSYVDTVELSGTPIETQEGLQRGTITANAELTQEGCLRGQWCSSTGTAGTFIAYPHGQEVAQQEAIGKDFIPEQFYTHNLVLGAMSLYDQDVRALITDLRKDFNIGRPVVTFSSGGREVTKYADDFLNDLSALGMLSYLKVQIQEPDAYGINRVVVVELRAYGLNEVRAQGVNESWVIGRAEGLANLLRRHENNLVTNYKKFGLNLNQFIFLVMLVAIPEIKSFTNRALFVAAIFVLLTCLLWLHSRFIPNTNIQLGNVTPTRLSRTWPTLVSWLFGIAGSLVAAYLYTWFTAKAS
ncbi:hypothetical protein [Pseudomonas fluorescens]|uniref:hypothetical protein n=1 Tax=Pseudomonas fluorescens TaxID=294 RepID=UPI003D1C4BF5